jgi:transposase
MDTSAFNPPLHPDAIQDLTDEQWQRIAPLLPEMLDRAPRRGRPVIDTRKVMNSVIWVLCTRKPWSAMPHRYVPYQTAHRYYLRWKRSGVLGHIVLMLFQTDVILERRVTRRGETHTV